ncbi:MAG: DNA mismatch repair protein MutS [Clostridia bacterium]|nr:DNA mismatch repair protein MutS [Clostridia bacterium]
MSEKEKKLSPMMQEYKNKKQQYPDCVLMYRLGDFYEMFFEDAERVAPMLGLTLTARDSGLDDRAPMCGVPVQNVETYINKLINKGEKVAICEQLEPPKSGKQLMKRDVVRVVTPGTVMETSILNERQNNYIACIHLKDEHKIGLSWVDISTGEFCVQQFDMDKAIEVVSDVLVSIAPSEIICDDKAYLIEQEFPCVKYNVTPKFYRHINSVFNYEYAEKTLLKQLKVSSVDVLDLADCRLAICSAGALVDYLLVTQKRNLDHINKVKLIKSNHFMHLDMNTRLNLEITESLSERKTYGSLLWVLDQTKTAMGARMLRNWLDHPLQDVVAINDRLDAIQELVNNNIHRANLFDALKNISDIERLSSRIAYGNLTPKNCFALGDALSKIPAIKSSLANFNSKMLVDCYQAIDDMQEISQMLLAAFDQDAPNSTKESGFIRAGFDHELDTFVEAKNNGTRWIMELEVKEKETTGLRSLKISHNKIIGYFFEISKTQSELVPFRFEKMQTLTTSERYMTTDLKDLQQKILTADEGRFAKELEIFNQIRNKLTMALPALQMTAKQVAIVDVLVNLANIAIDQGYTRPIIDQNIDAIRILDGRHPIVEKLNKTESFVPNDTTLSPEERTLIITGPNMAGKSTYMRQVALITYMAHVGCFVPATSAEIAPTDRIFTRIGASDNLGRGLSTFMVEMVEVAGIVQNATDKSLLILDEIGRGTSTYDGLSIAWSVVEYINNTIKAKTLFATHYHELSDLEGLFPGIKNYHILIRERDGSIIFLRKIVPGYSDKSFGLEVAELAGVPSQLIHRAREILREHEVKLSTDNASSTFGDDIDCGAETKLLEIKQILKDIDVNYLTPIEALAKLSELKKKI